MATAERPAEQFDAVFVGGGLSSVLCCLAVLAQQPRRRLAIVEREPRLGGNHTWCFHAADVPAAAHALIEPLTVQRWDGYAVRFPHRERRLHSPYGCITSERLDQVARAAFARAPQCVLELGRSAHAVEARRVLLDDGRVLSAKLVFDARGPSLELGTAAARGYQKFVGLELSLPAHGLREPIMFDALIPQHDGFRFMYLLPLSADRVLVEETFFSEGSLLDATRSKRAILDYAATHFGQPAEVLREERGVLPMPWQESEFDVTARPLSAGYRAGLFHPVTGYSFPIALRYALALADSDFDALAARPHDRSPLSDFARAYGEQRPFLRLLTKLLFTCFAPNERFGVLEHFYRLPESLIERFYAAELTTLDRARVFLGAPPRGFSVGRALRLSAGVAP
jgi:lycopene beta-cyclase